MELDLLQILYWTYPFVLLCYYASDLLITKKLIQKLHEHPLVGSPSALVPRVILNLIFAGSAVKVIEQGYRKFKDKTFQLIRNDGNVIVLPLAVLEELSSLPTTIASPHGALEHDLLGPYTSLDIILDSRLHHSIVQRKLTPRLGILTPYLQNELTAAFEDYFPLCDDWTEIKPYKLLGKLSARLSARAIVGPSTCRDPTWLNISVDYTESLFKTIVIMRLFPAWMHSFLCYLLPSYWFGRKYVHTAKTLLGPKIRGLLRKSDNGWSPDINEEDFNVLAWLADLAKGNDRNPDTLAHVEVLLALASVHTTLLRMVNVLSDLIANPGYFEELQEEITSVSQKGWSESSYFELQKLDSVLRESQRRSPPTVLGMKRLFKQSFTFSNGLHIPQGTYVCLPTFAIENDPEHTMNPDTFDGLRSYRLRQRKGEKENHQFSSAEPTVLNFGYGKSACPGRFFASLIIKMVFVKLLTEYEFRFLPGKARPKNLMAHEFLFPWPWDKVLMRRKTEGSCPF
ncbi:MAG: hypothetical protein MMC33_001553 [Icmadophila ericetorum]|nr:hypothetical protein [Icmadophila ericetorum]